MKKLLLFPILLLFLGRCYANQDSSLALDSFRSSVLNADFNATTLKLSSKYLNDDIVTKYSNFKLGKNNYIDAELPSFRLNLDRDYLLYYPAFWANYEYGKPKTIRVESSKINGNISGFSLTLDEKIHIRVKNYVKKRKSFLIRLEDINSDIDFKTDETFINLNLNGGISDLVFDFIKQVYKFSNLKFSIEVLNLDKDFIKKELNLKGLYDILSQNLKVEISDISFSDINKREVFISGRFGVDGYKGDLTKAIYVDLDISFDKEYLVLFTKGDTRVEKLLFSSGILISNGKKVTINIKTLDNNIIINSQINLNNLIKGSKYAESLENFGLKIDELDSRNALKSGILKFLIYSNKVNPVKTYNIFSEILDRNVSSNPAIYANEQNITNNVRINK